MHARTVLPKKVQALFRYTALANKGQQLTALRAAAEAQRRWRAPGDRVKVSDPDVRRWIDYVFDHPVGDPAWRRDPGATSLPLEPAQEAELYAETFERSEELLHRFSSLQLNEGLDYLTDNACSSHMFALLDPSVPEPVRLRALRSCWRQAESDPPGSRNLTHPATGRPDRAKSAIEI